jgi:hypothetical protein
MNSSMAISFLVGRIGVSCGMDLLPKTSATDLIVSRGYEVKGLSLDRSPKRTFREIHPTQRPIVTAML